MVKALSAAARRFMRCGTLPMHRIHAHAHTPNRAKNQDKNKPNTPVVQSFVAFSALESAAFKSGWVRVQCCCGCYREMRSVCCGC